ncbi:MAG: hypothetical protein HKN05_05390, partial [Rhizobiales bacterium]|nr:hypothetical protein [Hyphomicrobiales bacterium]
MTEANSNLDLHPCLMFLIPRSCHLFLDLQAQAKRTPLKFYQKQTSKPSRTSPDEQCHNAIQPSIWKQSSPRYCNTMAVSKKGKEKRKRGKQKRARGAPGPATKSNGGRKIYSDQNELVLESQIEEFNVVCSNTLKELKVDVLEEEHDSKYFGFKLLSDKTTDSYKGRLRKFIKFLLANQPHFNESLLIFHRLTPRNTIAVQAEAIRLFLHAAYAQPNQKVIDPISEEPMFLPDRKTHLLGCDSKPRWQDPDTTAGFMAAIKHIHTNVCDWDGVAYHERCEECATLFDKGDKGGCQIHPTRQNVRRGNVSRCNIVTDTVATIHKSIDWESKGANVLTPADLRLIREYV